MGRLRRLRARHLDKIYGKFWANPTVVWHTSCVQSYSSKEGVCEARGPFLGAAAAVAGKACAGREAVHLSAEVDRMVYQTKPEGLS